LNEIVVNSGFFKMSEADFAGFPLGLIEVDEAATIVQYNNAEQQLAHRTAESAIGKNFFLDVAPCTAVQDFQGRFAEFVKDKDAFLCDEVRFLFRFDWGETNVGIMFLREPSTEFIFIVVNTFAEKVKVVHQVTA
jgi:photoactive yellow protein